MRVNGCLHGLQPYSVSSGSLALALVGQACFLSGALDDDAVSMFGEPETGRITLNPPQWIHGSIRPFDLAINVDSFTDMSIDYAREYLDFIQSHLSLSAVDQSRSERLHGG
jgi:hypothetical protein